MSAECFLFAGPSLCGVDPAIIEAADVCVMPPARRGDVAKLTRERSPTTIALADGTFHAYPSVGHVELRDAIEQGWRVWGLSSMGAIRAAEMLGCGMLGFGEVFETFADDPDFSDDEVALLHGEEAPFRPLSEPLIHLRRCLRHLVQSEHIDSDTALALLERLKHRWFGERTLLEFRALVLETVRHPTVVEPLLRDFDAFRIKSRDLERFLETRAWRGV